MTVIPDYDAAANAANLIPSGQHDGADSSHWELEVFGGVITDCRRVTTRQHLAHLLAQHF
jgi:hypothetical protein